MKALLKITIALLILVSCEKANQPEISYDCFMKSTKFDSNDEVLIWETFFFKNDEYVKYEDSFGSITEFQYDNKGNVTCVCSNESKTEYEYNSDNNVVKTTYYTNNLLDYYTIGIYEDTLLVKAYSVNSESDTIGYNYYYYNSANMKDSVIGNHHDWYYYYSAEMDSIIIKSKENWIKSKMFKKHENGRMIYYEFRNYNPEGDVTSYSKTTREFNDKGLLIRKTEEGLQISNTTVWLDRRYFYNSSDKIVKTEDYDEANTLLGYSNYVYEDSLLTKVETFDPVDNLKAYSIIENKCNNDALLPSWYIQ